MRTASVVLYWEDSAGKIRHESKAKLRFSSLVSLGIELLGLLKGHVVFPSKVEITFE
jgi:hypothetical protein